jgi:tripartite-type tricarboxylate transporter receptor subunit TctC
VVHPSLPARSVPELIALAKSQPGKLNYASVGNGSAVHLASELFKRVAEVDIVHIPYKGSAPALADLLDGLGRASKNAPDYYDQAFRSDYRSTQAVGCGQARAGDEC